MSKYKINFILIFAHLLIVAIFPFYANAEAWKFIVYGDTRTNDVEHRAVLQAIMNNSPNYKFIINVGDLVEEGSNVTDWLIWQAACHDILGGIGQDSFPPKYMAAPGNHDEAHTPMGLANWITFLPGQAQHYGNDGLYFYFDYENARFIILDSNDFSEFGTGPQYDILMEAIQYNPQDWLFVIWHHPIFSFGQKEYRDDIHKTWGIPLYENRCDIFFVGHLHDYVRTKKLELNGEINPPLDLHNGTVQIVTGNGGARLHDVDPNKYGNGYMVESYIKDYGYCELTVDGDNLYLRHILKEGTVFDEEIYRHQNTLTISSSSGGTTYPSPGTYTYDSGTEVSITAMSVNGYRFSGWTGDVPQGHESDNPITITMDSDKSIIANFISKDDDGSASRAYREKCFVATAAYDSPLHPHISSLRDFRDKYLMSNKFGRELVGIYYKYSPYIAELIAKHRVLKVAVRINLLPLVAFSYSMVNFGPIIVALMLGYIFMFPIFFILFCRRKLRQRKSGNSGPE